MISARLADYKSIGEYAVSIKSAVRQTFPEANAAMINELVSMSFFMGLPQNHTSTCHLREYGLKSGYSAEQFIEKAYTQYEIGHGSGNKVVAMVKAQDTTWKKNAYKTEKKTHPSREEL